jgi:cellulose synthase/poly-beta-1,6-N-acetylglucosamine synthase-like glycosyltransferase
MWILILLFGLATAVLGWTLFGYFLTFWFASLFRRDTRPQFPECWPSLSVVIPCLDEIENVEAKIENLGRLDYPRDSLEVVFVDGGSTDGTVGEIRRAAEADPAVPLRLVEAPVRGKVLQINHVLPSLRGEIVVSTDVDARLEPDTLKWIAAEFATSHETGVVGAYCRPPEDAYVVDRYYWDAQNRGRFIESRGFSSSIVVAPCYGFRRELLTAFPDDVVADDVYIAFLCNTLGRRTVYSRYARAVELRSPSRLTEFLPHKFRKSNAFLLESLRFLYRLPHMKAAWRIAFLTRIAQQLFIPLALAAWMLVAASLVTLADPRVDVVGMGVAALLALLGLTSYAFRTVPLPDGEEGRYSIVTVAKGWVLTTLLLAVTGLTYPFYRQDSAYARMGESRAPRRAKEGAPEGAAAR